MRSALNLFENFLASEHQVEMILNSPAWDGVNEALRLESGSHGQISNCENAQSPGKHLRCRKGFTIVLPVSLPSLWLTRLPFSRQDQ
jgi:hypothetical protein